MPAPPDAGGEERGVRIWPGDPFPLGVTADAAGCNVAVHTAMAEGVELCVFDDDGGEERVALHAGHGAVWHGYLPDLTPGRRYGFRVHGPFDPGRGLWCNPAKLLLDPYARAIDGQVALDPAVLATDPADPDRPSTLDSAGVVPHSVVVQPPSAIPVPPGPRTRLEETVIYEVHVKGSTVRHPGVPDALKGTYAGVAHEAFVEHLLRLGVTAVELLPVHQFVHDQVLQARGLRNYWGYQTIGFFAPHSGYRSEPGPAGQVQEFRSMVAALHAAGLEVILDVVYNHTAEGNERGPTLCFRGLDNAYYHLDPTEPRRYLDFTGTGNTLDTGNPHVLQLIMDSLRYWVTDMGVDGFRFDLAAALGRGANSGPDPLASFFDVVQQDPVVSRVKLIAEPWDVGADGYQVGRFPPLWAEWNGRYRDSLRDVWRGVPGMRGELATRLAGSADLYEHTGRRPFASVNFVTAHDGFTLADLVAYERKHNDANGEDNRDGTDDNRSWNGGVEGPSDDPLVRAVRKRQQRNLLTTVLVAQGIPMLLGGDEVGRTQRGNNNAYCQDNEVSWFDWSAVDDDLRDFTGRLVALRRAHPVLRRHAFFTGQRDPTTGLPDIEWLEVDGTVLTGDAWRDSSGGVRLGVFLNGDAVPDLTRWGEPMVDDSFLLWVNAATTDVVVRTPPAPYGAQWEVELDTAADADTKAPHVRAGAPLAVVAHSAVLLRRPHGDA